MSAIAGALLPILALIAIGYALRGHVFTDAGFWRQLERLVYYVLFPTLLARTVAMAGFADIAVAPMAAALGLGVVTVAALVLAARRLPGPVAALDGPAFTSLFQCAIRPNIYVGLAAAGALFADAGLALAAVGLAVVVPLVNIASVAVLARYADGDASAAGTAAALAQNPIILAIAAGAILNALGGLPPAVDDIAASSGAPPCRWRC